MEESKNVVKKKAVVVEDSAGQLNHMVMFYIEPGDFTDENKEYIPEPDMFMVNGKQVAAVLISQYENVMVGDTPVSAPDQLPATGLSHDEAARACRGKGDGWHLLTNTEWMYLLNEAESIGHVIGGNTYYGSDLKRIGEDLGEIRGNVSGICLTGGFPLSWSHDGTKEGVFDICGNLWEHVAGLRLHHGAIEYIPENDAAAEDHGKYSRAWVKAAHGGKYLYLDAQEKKVVLTDGGIVEGWAGDSMKNVKIAGSLGEVPEIIYKLGILPRGWKAETAGIWADSEDEENIPFRGSGFGSESRGSAAALYLDDQRSSCYNYVGFRSALYLEDFGKVAEILAGAG